MVNANSLILPSFIANNFVPSLLNVNPDPRSEIASDTTTPGTPLTALAVAFIVEISYAVPKEYWNTLSSSTPILKILVPSSLNLISCPCRSPVVELSVSVFDVRLVVVVSVVALSPLLTVKVEFSLINPWSSCATGASFIPSTVIVRVAVSVKLPSDTV